MKISATIITRNETSRIRPCLDSLKWVDEIVVLDSNSTDDTVKFVESTRIKSSNGLAWVWYTKTKGR